MTLTEAERSYLATQPLGRLATRREDGTLQNNPVGVSYNAVTGTIDITGRAMGATHKFRNVSANGAVALVVDDLASRDPWTVRGVEIRGHAEALVDQQTPSAYTSPEIIRIHPQRVISWGLGDGDGMIGRDVVADPALPET
ncbi:MAG: PPOX class F420-dependent oxidoreductase [Ilumatobacteraceae bacterium]